MNLTVTCQGYGEVLTRDIIPSYSATATASVHLAALLAYQETERITLGGVDASLDGEEVPVEFTWKNIWEAGKLVRDVFGGYLVVEIDPNDPDTRELYLRATIGEAKGQQVRVNKNLTTLDYRESWFDYANRLYPVGKDNLLLSTKTFTRAVVAATADATYGYLALLEKHAAYKDWTGEGDALPANVTIEAPTGSWSPPDGFTASNWQDEANAYDGNESTYARYDLTGIGVWSPYLTLTYSSPVTTSQVRFPNQFAWYSPTEAHACLVEVDIYYSAAWHNVYSGRSLQEGYLIAYFAQQTVSSIRYRVKSEYAWSFGGNIMSVKEFSAWSDTGYADVTADFVQGENEKTFRCAVGDYTADIGYVVSYTHADYLIDYDQFTSRGDIVTKQQSFDEVEDVDQLIGMGRVALDEAVQAEVSMEVGMIDVSVEGGRLFEALELGNTVTVVDEQLGVEETARVVSIDKPDMARPEQMTVQVATKIKDILDVL